MKKITEKINKRLLKEVYSPESGAFWWVPSKRKWDLLYFYDSDYDVTDHIILWKYVVEKLAENYKLDPKALYNRIKNNYAGLPRGRVNKIANNKYTLVHGNDAPKGCNMNKVLSAFKLVAIKENVRILYDEHETMIEGDPEAVQAAIKVNLGLKGLRANMDDYYDDCQASYYDDCENFKPRMR